MLEQLKESLEELVEDHEDGAEEGVGAGGGAPGGEDGVGGFEHGDVEGEVGGGEGGDDLLCGWAGVVSTGQRRRRRIGKRVMMEEKIASTGLKARGLEVLPVTDG